MIESMIYVCFDQLSTMQICCHEIIYPVLITKVLTVETEGLEHMLLTEGP